MKYICKVLSQQAAHPTVHVIGRNRGEDMLRPTEPGDETFERMLILRPQERMFFANAQQVGGRIKARSRPWWQSTGRASWRWARAAPSTSSTRRCRC